MSEFTHSVDYDSAKAANASSAYASATVQGKRTDQFVKASPQGNELSDAFTRSEDAQKAEELVAGLAQAETEELGEAEVLKLRERYEIDKPGKQVIYGVLSDELEREDRAEEVQNDEPTVSSSLGKGLKEAQLNHLAHELAEDFLLS